MLPFRYWPFAACVLLAVVSLLALAGSPIWLWPALVFGALTIVGIADLLQDQQTLRRNYPVIAHLRYFLESIGPEIRQYFIEADTDERPFSRQQRAIVYQRAKNALDKRPFGTQLDVYADKYEWINHSLAPTEVASHDFRILIGEGRAQPYSASVFNISAMSFGALSANAVRALNVGARRGNFYQYTGEGSISQYHSENGVDMQSTPIGTPRQADMSGETVTPGSTPPWRGLARCDF
jgi:glutamate synthase domain-containing protein 2